MECALSDWDGPGSRSVSSRWAAMLMGTSTDEATSFGMLDRYLDAGGRFIDTADCYAWWPDPGNTGGESEEAARPLACAERAARRHLPGHQGQRVGARPRGDPVRGRQPYGTMARSVRRRRRRHAAAGARRQPAPARHRPRRPVLRPRRRPVHAAGGDARGPGRDRRRRQGPVHRLVQRADLAAGADPAAVRAARLAGAGRRAAAALVPAPEGRRRRRLSSPLSTTSSSTTCARTTT